MSAPRVDDYFRAGNIERGSRRGYRWTVGYSLALPDGATTQPWGTRAECCKASMAVGRAARFHATEADAREIMKARSLPAPSRLDTA